MFVVPCLKLKFMPPTNDKPLGFRCNHQRPHHPLRTCWLSWCFPFKTLLQALASDCTHASLMSQRNAKPIMFHYASVAKHNLQIPDKKNNNIHTTYNYQQLAFLCTSYVVRMFAASAWSALGVGTPYLNFDKPQLGETSTSKNYTVITQYTAGWWLFPKI